MKIVVQLAGLLHLIADDQSVLLWQTYLLNILLELLGHKGDTMIDFETHSIGTANRIIQLEEALLEAAQYMRSTKENMFAQCLSNPITNAWGTQLDTTMLNGLDDAANKV